MGGQRSVRAWKIDSKAEKKEVGLGGLPASEILRAKTQVD